MGHKLDFGFQGQFPAAYELQWSGLSENAKSKKSTEGSSKANFQNPRAVLEALERILSRILGAWVFYQTDF